MLLPLRRSRMYSVFINSMSLLLLSLPVSYSEPRIVEGCPDLDSVETIDISSTSLSELLLCFCQIRERNSVAVSCLYGSTVDHLERAALAVANANMSITQLSIQHMEFPPAGITEGMLATLTPELSRLDIRECAGTNPLTLHPLAFEELKESLVNVTIHDCRLKGVPAAMESLSNLNTLVLSSNDIDHVEKRSFVGKTKLKYLDLSGNMLTEIEEGSFADLGSLEALVIGEHNYVNESILSEIAHLGSLELLDLSRADGIFNPPQEVFGKLPMLKVLKMGGCSLSSIEQAAFSKLAMLEQLDLRVNLIENVSMLAFDGLGQLKRLSLAGNYIRRVDSDLWAGLGALEHLDLGWNELKVIDAEAFGAVAPSLNYLDLRHNPITTLPEGFALPELKTLILTETNITHIDGTMLKNLPKLESFEALRCNISFVTPDAFTSQKDTLKKLALNSNKLRSFDVSLGNLPHLEELSLAGNPFLCDDQLVQFIEAVHETHKKAAEESRAFAMPNTNETTCARPWVLRGKSILGLKQTDLKPYNETMDTTTAASVTTTLPSDKEEEPDSSVVPFTLPPLFAGKDTNESIFKDERERLQYDLMRTDNTQTKEDAPKSNAAIVTLLVMGTITTAILVAIILFVKKRRRVSPSGGAKATGASPEKKKMDDGMVEIELESGARSNANVAAPVKRA